MPAVIAAVIVAAVPVTATVAIGGLTVATILGNLLATVAVTALSRALADNVSQKSYQMVETQLTGGINPQFFPLGITATKGILGYPKLSHGGDSGTLYLTQLVVLSHVPGATIAGFALGDTYVDVDWGGTPHADYGYPVTTDPYDGYCWVKYYDGTQVAADPMMIAKYGSHPYYPYSSNMIGEGVCYAIVTTKASSKVWETGVPECLFEMQGIPLYDIRKDSTAGGSGAHRWNNKATWEPTENPLVIAYNLSRGIELGSGDVYGAEWVGADIDFDTFVAAANGCDALIQINVGGTTEPWYRGGMMVQVDMEPGAVVEEFMKAAACDIADSAGLLKFRPGKDSLVSYSVLEGRILGSEEMQAQPFPSFEQVHNGVRASYPEPESMWTSRDAPPLYDAALEAKDWDQRKIAEIQLPAVPFSRQVQRLTKAWLEDARRFRTHVIYLPPEAIAIEPMDRVSYTDATYQYTAKKFIVDSVKQDLVTLNRMLVLREVDPNDYNWVYTDLLPTVPVPTVPSGQPGVAPAGWAAAGATIYDDLGAPKKPALLLSWTPTDIQDNVRGIGWEVRIQGDPTIVLYGSSSNLSAGYYYQVDGVLPDTIYEARAYLIWDRPIVWSGWDVATTPDVRITMDDLDPSLSGPITAVIDLVPPAVPVGLSLSTSVMANGKARIIATWTANVESDLAYYEVRIKVSGGNYVNATTSVNRHEWEVTAGLTYFIGVRAFDRNNNGSAFGTDSSIVAAPDTTAPATPTGLAVVSSFETFFLSWNLGAETDLSYYDVYVHTASTPAPTAPTTPTYTGVSSTTLVIPGQPDSAQRWFWIRAVDTSGNKSAWTTSVNATTPSQVPISSADLAGLVNAAAFAAGIEPVELLSALPTAGNFIGRIVYLTATDGIYASHKLYRHVGNPVGTPVAAKNGFSVATDGADIVANSITAGQIQAAAIGTTQLAAQAVTARNMALIDMENLYKGGNFLGMVAADFTVPTAVTFTTGGPSGGAVLRLTQPVLGTSVNIQPSNTFFAPVIAGETYWLETAARAVTTNMAAGFYCRTAWYDSTNTFISSSVDAAIENKPLNNTTWSTFVGKTVAPANAAYAKFLLYNHSSNVTTLSLDVDRVVLRRANAAQLIVDGSIQSNHLTTGSAVITGTAQIATGIINNAHIVDLSAAKIIGGTALLGTVTVSGTALSTVETRASDPAARVNAVATQIDPGKILISGATSLSDWRQGGDLTKIAGGNISANTIDANKMTIGSRNVAINDITFEYNSPSSNRISWTAGTIDYTNDAGTLVTAAISANAVGTLWSSGILYVYWVKGATSLSTTTSVGTAFNINNLVVATYQGGIKMDSSYGRTIIDGSRIKTGSITAASGAIGNLAVDTLQLADKAVTVAAQVKNNKKYTLTSDVTWVQVCELSLVTVAGYHTDFTVSLALAGYATGVLQVAVYRGSSQVDIRPHTTAEKGSATQVSFSGIDQDKTGGKVTFAVKVRKAPGTYYTGNLIVNNVYLKCQQFKK